MAAHLSYLLERRARTFGRTELLSEEERVAALMLSITSQPCRCGTRARVSSLQRLGFQGRVPVMAGI